MRKLILTPVLQSAISQLCGAFPYYCLKFAYGAFTGFQIIFLAEMYKKDSGITITVDQLTWFAGLDFLNLLGSIMSSFLMHLTGTRLTASFTSALFIIPGLLYYYATDGTTVLIARSLTALTTTTSLSPPYVSEISEPHLRGTFLAICQMSGQIGTFFILLLGNLMHWRNIALVNLSFPVMSAVTVIFTPNSPSWLANKGHLDEAEKSLCWLRGWVTPDRVQVEFEALVENVHKSKTKLNDRLKDKAEAVGWKANSRNFFQIFRQRSFYLPLGTICLICLVHQFSGIGAIYSYSAVIFQKMNSPIKPSIATAIMGSIVVTANIVTLLLIRHTGKRKLAFFSVLVAGSCHALIALVGFLKLRGDYLWIPTIAFLFALFADFSGSSTIVYMLVSEIFPASVRYIGSSIGMMISMMAVSLVNKLFLYAVDAITLPGVFLLFAVVNFVAFVTYYFVMPETEGKSLEEIEDHFRGVKKLNEQG